MKRMAKTDIGYTADQIDALLTSGSLKRLGMGSRRACYRLPGGGLCVKCYRSEEEITEGKHPGYQPFKPLASSVVREIRSCRFDEKRNTCCQEYEYWKKLRDRLPADLMSVFPSTMEKLLLPSRGWCVVEELIANADGSPPMKFHDALYRADTSSSAGMVAAFNSFAGELVRFAVKIYDPQNILVQTSADGVWRFRIADFEPASRTLISLDGLSPVFIRMKLRRRFRHYNRKFGIRGDSNGLKSVSAHKRNKTCSGIGSDPISISFCISDSYAQHLAVVAASLLSNNPDCDFVFHVVHHSIRPETEAKLRLLETTYPRHKFIFHPIDKSTFANFPLPNTLVHVSLEMYYRYLLPDILGAERRTIYSDVDVLCQNGGIRALWEMDLGGRPMGAVRNPACHTHPYIDHMVRMGMKESSPSYFSGLLVMDLEKLRAEKFSDACMEMTARKADELLFPDMDVINAVMEGRMADIDPVWNMTERYDFFRRDVKIWHFLGQTQKPWCNIWKNVTWIPYMKYLLKTPYRGNAFKFLTDHLKGYLFFKYTKKCVTRYLIFGIRVWKRKAV